ncbi:MAG: hypothetical protein H6518_12970 [Microthrixaceae bacterium]|nr:hypothetical protein [Microthrixaceae bacterium]
MLDPTVGSASPGQVTDLAAVLSPTRVGGRRAPSGIAGGAVTGADGTYAIDGLPRQLPGGGRVAGRRRARLLA